MSDAADTAGDSGAVVLSSGAGTLPADAVRAWSGAERGMMMDDAASEPSSLLSSLCERLCSATVMSTQMLCPKWVPWPSLRRQ